MTSLQAAPQEDGSIFDLYNEAAAAKAAASEGEGDQDVPWWKQVGTGILKGVGDVMDIGSTISNEIQKVVPAVPESIKSAMPTSVLGVPVQAVKDIGAGITDVQAQPSTGLTEDITRRVTRSAPGLLGGPAVFAEMSLRDLMGLGGKKIAEELGLGETGQAIFDLGFSLSPNPKKYIETGSKVIKMAEAGQFTTQKEMVETARKLGMTEEEIAPLVREGPINNLLRKISPKRGAAEKALHRTKSAVGRNFNNLAASPEAQVPIQGMQRQRLVNDLQQGMGNLPAGARNAIAEDVRDLMNSNMTGADVINFWGDVNSYFKEHPKLQGLKNPLRRALSMISPEFGQNFEMANTLSQRFREVAGQMKPSIASDLFGASEATTLLGSVITGNLPLATKVAATVGGRKLVEMMVTSPRWQNLHKKMVTTINAGQIKATKQIFDQMIGMVAESSPEAAAQLRAIDMDEIESIINRGQESKD